MIIQRANTPGRSLCCKQHIGRESIESFHQVSGLNNVIRKPFYISKLDTNIVQHYISAMKNVTIKLENDVAHWARIWAAEHNTSVSQVLGELLKRMKKEKTGYVQAMHQFLSVDPQPLKEFSDYPSRDDLHER